MKHEVTVWEWEDGRNSETYECSCGRSFNSHEEWEVHRTDPSKGLDRTKAYFLKETSDDWHPSYTIEGDARFTGRMYVVVTLHPHFTPEGYLHRVSVWGKDDLGMEMDTEDFDVAKKVYRMIATHKYPITREWLQEWGFVPA